MIEIHHLRMEYDATTVALDNLDLEIPAGEVYGLIGPNGAGKTTLLRILATLLEPTCGSVHIDGINILAEPHRIYPILGYMSDFFSLYDEMLVWEYLDHFARCNEIERSHRCRLIEEVLKLVSLDAKRDTEIQTLSRGMRQRLCFARTLLHEPKLLLLDEPASGLDPAGRLEFRELLKQLQAMGRTIVISSHILTEMCDFCTAVGIFEEGKVIATGRVSEILQRLQPDLDLEIEVGSGRPALLDLLKTHRHVERINETNHRVRCRWRGDRKDLAELNRHIIGAGIELVSVAVKEPDLEDLYMKISGHKTS
jgi:ABC-2 type transport system ATP-binding protein